jgi:hypothetical protein
VVVRVVGGSGTQAHAELLAVAGLQRRKLNLNTKLGSNLTYLNFKR